MKTATQNLVAGSTCALIAFVLMAVGLFGVFGAIGGCKSRDQAVPNLITYGQYAITLETLNHDGCQFVVMDGASAAGIVHHPNCKFCRERQLAEQQELRALMGKQAERAEQ